LYFKDPEEEERKRQKLMKQKFRKHRAKMREKEEKLKQKTTDHLPEASTSSSFIENKDLVKHKLKTVESEKSKVKKDLKEKLKRKK
jgi:hypothetical protein